MACSSRSPGAPRGSRRKRASSAFSLRIMRRRGFILLAFLLAGAPAHGEERSTRVSAWGMGLIAHLAIYSCEQPGERPGTHAFCLTTTQEGYFFSPWIW